MYSVTKCRICRNEVLELVLDLGHHPPSDAFLTDEQLNEPEIHYPLVLMYCPLCELGQLSVVVPRETLFNEDYPYATGVNPGGVFHFRELSEWIYLVKEYGSGTHVMDIGSNDGTLLKFFREAGCHVYGIEPCKHLCQIANENDVLSVPMFFDGKSIETSKFKENSIDIITATNVFAHVNDIHDFMRTVRKILANNGIFVVEMPDFKKMIEFKQFDQIYHEHLSYFHPKPMGILSKMHDMKIKTWQAVDIHGGSIRYVLVKN